MRATACIRRAFGAVVAAILVVGQASPPSRARADAAAAPPSFSMQIGGPYATAQVIAAGPDGGVFVAGFVHGPDIFRVDDDPAAPSPPDHLWVAALAKDGALRWVSYAAARESRYQVYAWSFVRDLAVAADGSVWILATDGIVPSGAAYPGPGGALDDDDAGVARFSSEGTLLFAMNLGGTGREQPTGLALTPDGDAVVVGTTGSSDFPVVDAVQPQFGGGKGDGFVARVRGDGSGLAWSTYLGGPETDDANAVAVDLAGDVLVTLREVLRDREDGYPHYAYGDETQLSAALARLSASGAVTSTIPLPHGDAGGAYALATTADGAVLVGGVAVYSAHDVPDRTDGFVLRIEPGASSVGAVWHGRGMPVVRMTIDSHGHVFAGSAWYERAGWFVLPADLRGRPRRVTMAEPGGYDVDATVAGDGALCFVNRALGAAFGAAPDPPDLGGSFVVKVPLTGIEASSRTRVLRTGRRTADLVWTRVAGTVTAWQIERVGTRAGDEAAAVLATLPASARSARVDGLSPGTRHSLRAVALLASGERVAAGEPRSAFTTPVPPRDVVEVRVTDTYVVVRCDTAGNGRDVLYDIQRRVGDGDWLPVAREPGEQDVGAGSASVVTALVRAPLQRAASTFRVRARYRHRTTRWAESARIQVRAMPDRGNLPQR